MKDIALGSNKTEEDVFTLGGSILDVELESDSGKIALATTTNQIPDNGTKGFALGAKVAFKQGNFSDVYVNRGDEDGCLFVKETQIRNTQEQFTIVHNANIESVSKVKKLVHFLSARGGSEGLGSLAYSSGGSGSWSGDDGGVIIPFAIPALTDAVAITDDASVATSAFSQVYVSPLPDGKCMFIADLGAAAPMIQFDTDIGETKITVLHHLSPASKGQPLYVGNVDGSLGFKVGNMAGARYFTSKGQIFDIDAAVIGGGDLPVYVKKADPNQFLSANFGTGDDKVATIDAAELIASQHVFPTEIYFDESADPEERLIHESIYLPRDFKIPVLGTDRILEVVYNENASTDGVPVYINPITQRPEADIPSESDAVVWTSERLKSVADTFVPEPPSL